MPQLNITFTKGTGAVDFQVCHKPELSTTWICQTYSASVSLPITITQGIVCGTSYDVKVKKICATNESTEVTAYATKVECGP
jgi:hypothetical protein